MLNDYLLIQIKMINVIRFKTFFRKNVVDKYLFKSNIIIFSNFFISHSTMVNKLCRLSDNHKFIKICICETRGEDELTRVVEVSSLMIKKRRRTKIVVLAFPNYVRERATENERPANKLRMVTTNHF